jgi:hypothetical protein
MEAVFERLALNTKITKATKGSNICTFSFVLFVPSAVSQFLFLESFLDNSDPGGIRVRRSTKFINREVVMPKLRHLAIRTEDTGKLASFYMDVFEMQVLHKAKEEGGAIFLTDGYFNLAILPNHEQNAPNGLYHFGFEVESGEKIVERMKKINPNKLPKARPNGRPYAETRGSDPDGNYFDISEHGFENVVPLGEKKPN